MPPTRAEQGDINSLKRATSQFGDRNRLIPESQSLTHRTRRGQQRQLPYRELTFLERFDHLDADGTRRTDHSNMRIAIHKGRLLYRTGRRCQTCPQFEEHQAKPAGSRTGHSITDYSITDY